MPTARLPLAIALALAFCAGAAHAEIYRCTGKHALVVYQNFPCDVDSLGMATIVAKAAPATAAGAYGAPPMHPAGTAQQRAASTRSQPLPAAPRVGMTTDDVRAIWGEPVDASREEPAKGDIEIWTYANSATIEFDRRGRVTSIRW